MLTYLSIWFFTEFLGNSITCKLVPKIKRVNYETCLATMKNLHDNYNQQVSTAFCKLTIINKSFALNSVITYI